MDGSADHGVHSNTHEGDQHYGNDEILSMDDDYDDLVDNTHQMMNEVEANNEEQYMKGSLQSFKTFCKIPRDHCIMAAA